MAGMAAASATREDQIIPSALLGGTISGLISRSILPKSERGAAKLHGCLQLDHLKDRDISRWFVDEMTHLAAPFVDTKNPPDLIGVDEQVQNRMTDFVQATKQKFGLASPNQVKIGLGETVRAAIRRIPECIILRDHQSEGAVILRELAEIRNIPLEKDETMPVASAAILGGKRIALPE